MNIEPMEDVYISMAFTDGTRVEIRPSFPSGEIPLALYE